jgi:HlyD family secretion protein
MERSGTATKFEELSEQRGRVRKADADLLAARKSRQALEVRTTSDIDQAQAKADLARAELSEAQKQLDYCEIHAPVTGTILTKKAEKGNYVNPIAFNVSASLCDMADLSDLEVDLYIQERDIAQVHPKQECRVVSEAYPDRPPYRGTVSRLMPTADRAKGAIPVRVKLTVPGGEQGMYLRPDMSVIVSFLKDGK